MTTAKCRRCDAPLENGYGARLVSAQEHHQSIGPDGSGYATVLAASSACSWNCLAVLAAQLAGPDADAAVQVVAERERQVTAEGWTPEHDDTHPPGELALAGACYAIEHVPQWVEDDQLSGTLPNRWPWDAEWWKPKDPERDLVRAGALVAAEADRLVRARRDRF